MPRPPASAASCCSACPSTRTPRRLRRDRSRRHPQRRRPASRPPRRATRSSCRPTSASTSSPTTATAACSTRTAASTTTPRSSATATWRVAQAEAGSQLLGLSRHDGRPGRRGARCARRRRLRRTPPILAYAAKYASAFYGPFREAVRVARSRATAAPTSRTPRTAARALRELDLDLAEGADIVMVKPAMSYLDVLADAAATSPVPVWAYQVSGEYAMIEAAAAQRLDRPAPRDRGVGHRHPPRRRRRRAHLLGDRSSRGGSDDDAERRERVRTARARHCPGGVNSPVRAFRSVGRDAAVHGVGAGPVRDRRRGPRVRRPGRLVGPAILGHAHPRGGRRRCRMPRAAALSFGAATPGETELAELVADRVRGQRRRRALPIEHAASGVDRHRGDDDARSGSRAARTGRDLIVKFAGHYHGHSDGLLAEAGSGVATLALPGSAGVTGGDRRRRRSCCPTTTWMPCARCSPRTAPRIAAVIVEAAAANMGVVPPLPGLQRRPRRDRARARRAPHPRRGADRASASAPAGWWGLDPRCGSRPTSSRSARSSAAGLPLAALGGRRRSWSCSRRSARCTRRAR